MTKPTSETQTAPNPTRTLKFKASVISAIDAASKISVNGFNVKSFQLDPLNGSCTLSATGAGLDPSWTFLDQEVEIDSGECVVKLLGENNEPCRIKLTASYPLCSEDME